MSPSSQFHAKKSISITDNNNNGLLPPHLKINNDSHLIKKSSSSSSSSPSPSSSSSSSSSSIAVACTINKPLQRHPVIIYTHSPKIIHTHPKDFMALVQKLTGLSRSDEDDSNNNNNNNSNLQLPSNHLKQEPRSNISVDTMVTIINMDGDCKKLIIGNKDNNETSSVVTEENNCCSSIGENQVNSCFVPSILEPPMNPYMENLPMFTTPSTTEFMCSGHQPLLNYSDSLFLSHSMRTSIPSSSTTLEGVNEF